MAFKTFDRDAAARETGVSPSQLDALREADLVRPAVETDDGQRLFDEANLQEIRTLRGLLELGYGLNDVRKILRKVGVPTAPEVRPHTKGRLLTVGELATRAGLNPRTIKYWEEIEILTPIAYSEGGFRLYTDEYVLFCHLIRDLQLFGYSLKEIKDTADLFRAYYALATEAARSLERIGTQATMASLDTMLTHIDALRQRMAVLREGIQHWEGFTAKYGKRITKLRGDVARHLKAAPAPKKNRAASPAPREEPA